MRIIILSLLLVLANIGLFAQDATPDDTKSLDLICTDCELSANIVLANDIDCASTTLQLQLDIEGDYDENGIEWEGQDPKPMGLGGTVDRNSGVYKVSVKKGEACVATASYDTDVADDEIMEQFFKDNCFISIPVGFMNPGGSGIRNNRATSRNTGLIISIEGIEGEFDVNEIFGIGNLPSPYCSSDCDGYADGLLAFQSGTTWAHVIPNDDNTTGTLYLGANMASDNEFGQSVADAYFDFWIVNSTDGEALTAPLDYTCGSGQFLGSKFGDQWLEYLYAVYECEDWGPKVKGKGIFPHCLWEKFPEPLDYYGTGDIPFFAGLVDGGYQQLQDLPELVKLLKSVINHNLSLQGYVLCRLGGIDEDFYNRLEQKIADPGFFDYLKIGFNKILSVTPYDCGEALEAVRKHKEVLNKIRNFLGDKAAIQSALATIGQKLYDYYTTITTCEDLITCNNARYEHGKIVINLASLVTGIGVEDALFKTFTYLSKIIGNIPVNKIGNFLDFAKNKASKIKKLTPEQRLAFDDASQILPPSAWNKLVDDPELLEVWAKLRNKGCTVLVGRNSLNKCEELLIDVFGRNRPDLIHEFAKDADIDDFWRAVTENKDLVRIWEGLSERATWVRGNPNLLQKLFNNPEYDVADVNQFYARFHAPANFNGKDRYGSIDYDEFGFPDFRNHTPGDEYYAQINMDGTDADYRLANFDLMNRGIEIRELPLPPKTSNGSPILIKVNGQFEGPFTWHHHEDGTTMMPVIQDIHNSPNHSHTGGRRIVSFRLIGLFDSQ